MIFDKNSFASDRIMNIQLKKVGYEIYMLWVNYSTMWNVTALSNESYQIRNKQVSMITIYHNQTPQTNLQRHKEEPHNTDCHKT